MTSVGLLSDTHGYVDKRIITFFEQCDEIWHAGDIGTIDLFKTFGKNKLIKAVYGNIDNHEIRKFFPAINTFKCEEVDVLITHIGGYPNHYTSELKKILSNSSPKLLICGHSHILKVIYDKKHDLLFINPGAAGINGFHKKQTAVRFIIDRNDIRNLEIWESDRNKIV